MNWPYRIAWLLAVFAVGSSSAQETETPSVKDRSDEVARSSNLSAALPPSEWNRVQVSVDTGLEWLASQQADDGRFPSDEIAQPAVTSLAVMAFLARGHSPDQAPYGEQLSKAIDFVLSTQQRRGCFSLRAVLPVGGHLTPGQTAVYNHSIAGLMLGEVYGMSSGKRSERIEEAISKALIYHREVQSRTKASPADVGGWRYAYPESPKAASDLSVTGWALMFLRSARNAEFNVPKQYFDEGLDFVERCYEPEPPEIKNGVFRYRPIDSQKESPQITLANTASATLTLLLGGREKTPGVRHANQWFLSQNYPRPWENNYFYLASYYSSQAIAQFGGDTWNQVFPQIAAHLLDEQSEQGAWPVGASNEKKFGQCYSTSLAILALTPAYQLLPIYQR